MELIEFFKDKKFAGCKNIYIRPHIPLKKLSNAIEAYNIFVESKEVVVLIDDTAFGSAKDGVLICEDRLIVREMFSSAQAYQYDSIESIECEDRQLYINGRQAMKLNIPGKDELGAFFELLSMWIVKRDHSIQKVSSQKTASINRTNRSGIGAFLYEAGRKVVSDKLFVNPNIPSKKLQSAINSYGNGIPLEDVIVLVDDTAFGSAKDGILITEKNIYIKIFTESVRAYEWSSIETIEIEKKTIFINGAAISSLVQTTERDLRIFFNKINEFLSKKELIEQQHQELDSFDTHERFMDKELSESEDELEPPKIGTKAEEGFSLYGSDFTEDNLISHIKVLVAANKSKILPLLAQDEDDYSFSVLQDDSALQKLASYFYQILPLSVKQKVSELALSQCLLKNREKLLGQALLEEILLHKESACSELITQTSEKVNDDYLPVKSTSKIIETQIDARSQDGEIKEGKIKDKLLSYAAIAIEQNKPKIIALIKEKTGELSLIALRNDSNIEKLASYIYAFLPSLVRLALKEDVFVRFMLDNRTKLLDVLVEENVFLEPQNNSLIKSVVDDDVEGKLTSLLENENSSEDDGRFVLAQLSSILADFKQELKDEPSTRMYFQLASKNLTAVIEKIKIIQDYPRVFVEEQVGYILALMYGFAYHKVPEPLRVQDSIFEVYMLPLIDTLGRYDELSGSNLCDVEHGENMAIAYSMARVATKDQLNQMVRQMIYNYQNKEVSGPIKLDDVMLLLRKANEAAENWVISITKEFMADEQQIQNKWGDLLN